MRNDLIAVCLVLEKFNVHQHNMKCIQKSVYLAKMMGVKLGYSFGWYLQNGVYSPELNNDCYRISSVKNDYYDYKFCEDFERKLNDGMEAIEKPNDFIKMDMWIDFVASIVFLANDEQSYDEIAEVLSSERNFPLDYYENTYVKLQTFELI